MSGKKCIEVFEYCRLVLDRKIFICGVRSNNFKGVDVDILLLIMMVVIGVLGFGKSLLVNEVLYKLLV